jgi:hypothetical protein
VSIIDMCHHCNFVVSGGLSNIIYYREDAHQSK